MALIIFYFCANNLEHESQQLNFDAADTLAAPDLSQNVLKPHLHCHPKVPDQGKVGVTFLFYPQAKTPRVHARF